MSSGGDCTADDDDFNTDEEEEVFARLATQEEKDNFVELCGDGDLESVTQLLDEDPLLIQAENRYSPCKI